MEQVAKDQLRPLCPATGKPCVGACRGPKRVEFTLNGRESDSFEGMDICGKAADKRDNPPSPTSSRSILGERALRLINMDQ